VRIAEQGNGSRRRICICSVLASSRGVRFAGMYCYDL